MNEYGVWLIGLAVVYTFLLIFSGYVARRKAARGEDFFVGGRQFSPLVVALCITGLFSGSTYISILELAYLKGISAVWYGVAETVQVLIIAFILLAPFRERMLVTISGLIGDYYGRWAKLISGAITAFSFPMWSVATAIAFASAIHVFTGIPLFFSVALTSLLLFIYLQAGGMWSVAFTQSVNAVVFSLMFVVGLIAFFCQPGNRGSGSASPNTTRHVYMGKCRFTSDRCVVRHISRQCIVGPGGLPDGVVLPNRKRRPEGTKNGSRHGDTVCDPRCAFRDGRCRGRPRRRQGLDRHSPVSHASPPCAFSRTVFPRHMGLCPELGSAVSVFRGDQFRQGCRQCFKSPRDQ